MKPALTADRMRAAANVWIVAMAATLSLLFWFHPEFQVGRDFAVLWTAGRMALDGHLADVYDDLLQTRVVAMIGPASAARFNYPPVALLLYVPFALLPFGAAKAVWVGATATAFAAVVRGIAGRSAILAALACPATLVCALYVQNGMLLAALLGAAALLLDRAPVLAGIAIGCLIYKPHVAVLAPVLLALTGRWRAVAAAGATAAILLVISVLVFGTASWAAFLAGLPAAQALYADGIAGFDRFVSPYMGLRLLGASAPSAWIVQAIGALAAAGFLLWAARRAPDGKAAMAAMLAATGFCVPFLGEYDLPILIVPAAWLIAEADRNGWLPFERAALLLLYLSPMIVKLAAGHAIPFGPPAMALLLLSVARRLRRPYDPTDKHEELPCPARCTATGSST